MAAFLRNFPRYWKLAVAMLTPVFLVIQSATTDGTVTQQEWVSVLGALVGVLLVYAVPNAPKGAPTKKTVRRTTKKPAAE